MIIPVLNNTKEIIKAWKSDEDIERQIGTDGTGAMFDEAGIADLVTKLKHLSSSLTNSIEFDRKCAKLLYQHLNLSQAAAAERRFWQWFSIVHAQEIVVRRWVKAGKTRAHVTESRWMGGWKDTFRRLWLRANLVEDSEANDSTWLMELGDEDYWVNVVERDLAACRLLVRTLTWRFFANSDQGLSKNKQDHWRLAIKRLRQIRPSRACEGMNRVEIEQLVDDVISATKAFVDGKKNINNKSTRKPKHRKKRKRK